MVGFVRGAFSDVGPRTWGLRATGRERGGEWCNSVGCGRSVVNLHLVATGRRRRTQWAHLSEMHILSGVRLWRRPGCGTRDKATPHTAADGSRSVAPRLTRRFLFGLPPPPPAVSPPHPAVCFPSSASGQQLRIHSAPRGDRVEEHGARPGAARRRGGRERRGLWLCQPPHVSACCERWPSHDVGRVQDPVWL